MPARERGAADILPGDSSRYLRLERKVVLFRRYFDLTEGMKHRILMGDGVTPGDLAAFASKRRALAREIDGIDPEHGNRLPKQGDPDPVPFTDAARQEERPLLRRLGGILTDLKVVEGELMDRLRREADDIKMDLLRMRQERKAAEGYGGARPGAPRFLNTRK